MTWILWMMFMGSHLSLRAIFLAWQEDVSIILGGEQLDHRKKMMEEYINSSFFIMIIIVVV